MGSTRLPGKALMPAAGKPLLEHLIERLRRARSLNHVIVATTTMPEDDQIEAVCRRLGAGCFRGSVDDVLGRVAAALDAFRVDVHVEVHGDGPLADWRLVDHAVEEYCAGGVDLVTNAVRITYPPGLELWIYASSLCARLAREAAAPKYRESPILYVMERPGEFRIRNIEAPPELHAPDTYLEVDEAADFAVMKTVIERLYPSNPAFLPEDALALLQREPQLAESNRAVVRRWKAAE
ncbi:MAG: glycosyltransferase family protein [Acidobacteriia bacterium]|nr:glycosyltransferase family protein [Terriglobia bacterium]